MVLLEQGRGTAAFFPYSVYYVSGHWHCALKYREEEGRNKTNSGVESSNVCRAQKTQRTSHSRHQQLQCVKYRHFLLQLGLHELRLWCYDWDGVGSASERCVSASYQLVEALSSLELRARSISREEAVCVRVVCLCRQRWGTYKMVGKLLTPSARASFSNFGASYLPITTLRVVGFGVGGGKG